MAHKSANTTLDNLRACTTHTNVQLRHQHRRAEQLSGVVRDGRRAKCEHVTLTSKDDGATEQAFESRDGKRRNHVLHQLGCRQDHGLRTPVPAVAGTESLLEEGLLVVDAGLLVQGSVVPEDPHINNAEILIPLEVFPDDVEYNRQVKPRWVWVTSGQQSLTCALEGAPTDLQLGSQCFHDITLTSTRIISSAFCGIRETMFLGSYPTNIGTNMGHAAKEYFPGTLMSNKTQREHVPELSIFGTSGPRVRSA